MKSLTEQYIVDVIQKELDLPVDSVWIQDQNRTIPADKNLYVVVGLVDGKPIGQSNYLDSDGSEVQEIVVLENIQIDVFSRGLDAITRRWEVALALHSIYSRQVQEANNFKVFKNPLNFVNSSGAEGGSNINRFTATFTTHVWYRKKKVLSSVNGDYYSDFKQRVDDEVSIGEPHGIIEFEITKDGVT